VISAEMLFQEAILEDDDLLELTVGEDIIEGIEIVPEYRAIDVQISRHLIVEITE